MMFLKILYLYILISTVEDLRVWTLDDESLVNSFNTWGFTDEYESAFDQQLYERVIDEQKCNEQLEFLWNNSAVGLQFQDASGKIPTGILSGNLVDLGDYHACLAIKHVEENVDIEGKYCMMQYPSQLNQHNTVLTVPLNMGLTNITNVFSSIADVFPNITKVFPNITVYPNITEIFPNIIDVFPNINDLFPNITDVFPNITDIFPLRSNISHQTLEDIIYRMRQKYAQITSDASQLLVREMPAKHSLFLNMAIGTCIPKVCRPKQAIQFFQQRLLSSAGLGLEDTNITYNESYCRLPNDKPLSIADYLAFVIFSFIGFVTIMSTAYDLYEIFVLKKKKSEINPLYRCCSVYTNTQRFLTFNKVPGALECVDGVRAISMLWVVVGHTYTLSMMLIVQNIKASKEWVTSFSSTWVIAGPIAVDTFFLLSGILCVYSIIGKVSQRRFIASLHLFYLHRILRILPLLSAMILLQASVFHRLSDGPLWSNMAHFTVMCRKRWWSALLHVQNYIKPVGFCLYQSWYMSVDLQLYMFSPVILFWLLGGQRVAWCALSAIILVSFALTTTVSFLNNYTASLLNLVRVTEFNRYFINYYINPLTRASPFFIGMMYGYLLVQCKGKKIRIAKMLVCIMWILAFAMMAFCILSMFVIIQEDHDSQMFDNFLNSYMRGIWALAVGWMIFACVHGYGGPINWFLSLQMWKLPARLSYAMYLTHYSLILLINGSMVTPFYFDDGNIMYRAIANTALTTILAFVLSVTIDAPCSSLQKLLLGGGVKKSKAESQEEIIAHENDKEKTAL